MVEQQPHEPGSQWDAIVSIAAKTECSTQTLRNWMTHAKRDTGKQGRQTSEERDRFKALGRKHCVMSPANEILRRAIAFLEQVEQFRDFGAGRR